jgi:hypothetical protein
MGILRVSGTLFKSGTWHYTDPQYFIEYGILENYTGSKAGKIYERDL